ncbi:MAG: Asp-tRNA(Asn)/Glu-tRNA(Gln) amidotransferase subunit GatB [Bacteroidota bacterium]
MSTVYEKYEAVIGLEVHAQLFTHSKAFSSDAVEYGDAPNTHVSEITLGHPGTLPVMNKSAIEFAVKMGLATNCTIRRENQFARKNYFYPDLPKGYQITQHTTPICYDGFVLINMEQYQKRIGITRIHLEEDAGKSLHDQDPYFTLIDLNRAGTPLIEIVTEPDIRSSDEAYVYLTEIRKLVRFLGICDGNMEEGSLRCDANVSVRLKGASAFGAKVEVKNMNSIRNVKRALEHEIIRQIDAIESGAKISQDTRSFDAMTGTTFSMRSKEMANDYRYFPEPDLPPVILDDAYIHRGKEMMPELPEQVRKKFMEQFALSEYDASIISDDKELTDYFEEIIKHTKNYKAAANWMLGPVKSYLNEQATSITQFPVPATTIADLIALIDEGKVSFSVAQQKIFPVLLTAADRKPEQVATDLNLIQLSDTGALEVYIQQVLDKYPQKVEEYRNGKKGVIGLFMGEVMKLSGGKADPKLTNQLIAKKLDA